MKDVIISDLSQCQPSHRLDRDYRHGTWRLINYENRRIRGHNDLFWSWYEFWTVDAVLEL